MGKLRRTYDSETELEKAFETYADMVFRLALSRTKNSTYADDVLGEVFLRLAKNMKKMKSEEHIKAWLVRVTINCSNTYLKKISKETELLETKIPTFDEAAQKEVYSAVLSLSEKYQTVVHLFYYEGFSIKEISLMLKQSESATKMQLKRAKEKLKTVLGDEF